MKAILSYWDVSLGLIAIGFGIYRWAKYFIYVKKRDDNLIRKNNGKWESSYSRYMDDRYAYTMCLALIVFGALFIYNRIKGNMPNIIIPVSYTHLTLPTTERV